MSDISDFRKTIPVGAVEHFAANQVPNGWLKANGAAVSRTAYSRLFAVIGTTYGNGDGTTTFDLPDLRGEFIRSFDDGRGVDSGRNFGSNQGDEFASHDHTATLRIASDSGAGTSSFAGGVSSVTGTGTTNNRGGGETRPRNIALIACIKY